MAKKEKTNPMLISGINHGGRAKGQARKPSPKFMPKAPGLKPASRITGQ